jgi:tetratricopeptide (TPR) repeat protein
MAHSPLARRRRPYWPWMWLPLMVWAGVGIVAATGGTAGTGITDSSRGNDPADSLLADYFRRFLVDHDFEAFRDRVDARYSEVTLCRLLVDSPDVTIRRAAVVALSTLGSFSRSNPVLGRALRDSDLLVRRLAEDALWSVWSRADTPENNHTLERVKQLVGRGELIQAETLVSRLIVVAPHFAEAYNQRAIISFEQGRFAESARDCRRALDLNPFHFGALAGMAQCQLGLNRPIDALETLRRASKLQPYNTAVREHIRFVEGQIERQDSR